VGDAGRGIGAAEKELAAVITMEIGSVEKIVPFGMRLQGYQVDLVSLASQALCHISGVDTAARAIETVLVQYADFHIPGFLV